MEEDFNISPSMAASLQGFMEEDFNISLHGSLPTGIYGGGL